MPPGQILWMDQDPDRLERDRIEIGVFAPGMTFEAPGSGQQVHGRWTGPIPKWPFERARPDHLDSLIGPDDFEVSLAYPSAYPMTPPLVFPISVRPEPLEHSQAMWHVAPSGMLCLLQSTGGWLPEASVTELLEKAAGWRIEYALMKLGAIDRMTTNGIVSDPVLDATIAVAVRGADSTVPAHNDV